MQNKLRTPTQEELITLAYMAGILLFLIAAWEGLKWFGQANEYYLDAGPVQINLNIAKDLNMPHLKDILKAFTQPAQRNGPPLIEVLLNAAFFTFRRAFGGFLLGTLLGLLLAVAFVHSRIIEGGCLPLVIASQTVPILAIAPMIVIWTGRVNLGSLGVPIIAAYLVFFPMTIYALRGLADVPQTAFELMESYAATRWEILIKLRLPNSIPYIFTALKITGPVSVAGAIIGELPLGIQSDEGLGGAILNYAQYYTSGPPKLWATIVITALLGISFFVVIALLEKTLVRWKPGEGQ